MRVPAEQFLTVRAFGAPPTVIALAAQGTFRGFMDTKTPLYAVGKQSKCQTSYFILTSSVIAVNLNIFSAIIYCAGAGNLLNAILDPILIFLLGLGIGGAAIATVIAEYVQF